MPPQKHTLGNSDLEITPLGIGAWAMGGGDWRNGWGPQEDNESVRAIHRAIDCGINWIDTAAVYGHGHSEMVVAKALKTAAIKPYVFTKCGRLPDGQGGIMGCLRAASVRKECEESLRLLNVEAIERRF